MTTISESRSCHKVNVALNGLTSIVLRFERLRFTLPYLPSNIWLRPLFDSSYPERCFEFPYPLGESNLVMPCLNTRKDPNLPLDTTSSFQLKHLLLRRD